MLIPILVVIGVLLVVFVLFVMSRPDTFQVVRSATIAAPQPTVFGNVNDFRRWEDWSPWAKIDPTAKNWFEGPAAGTDAVFGWSGNKKVGEGQMTIMESRPHDLIRLKLEFKRPFACTNEVIFTFKPEGSQTRVTWDMSGKANFFTKAFGLFCNMDKMVGKDFEKGLKNLATLSERKIPA